MKKLLFVITLAFGCYTAQAQNSGWETGATVSVGVSDQFYTGVPSELKPLYASEAKRKTPNLHYSAGLYGRKFFKESYGIELGVQYTSFSLSEKMTEAVDITGAVIGTGKINQRHNYVEIPLRFVFKKSLGIFGIGCFAGVSPAFLTHAEQRIIITPNEGKRYVETNDRSGKTKPFNVFADAGLLLRTNVSKCFALDLKPFLRVAVFGTNAYSTKTDYLPANPRYFSGGLTLAGVWKF